MALGELLRNILGTPGRTTGRSAFGEMAARFGERLAAWPAPETPRSDANVAVLVTTWVKTATPFFALECVMALRDAGAQVRIFWDTTDLLGNAANAGEVEAVSRALTALPTDIAVVDVAALPAAPPLDETQAAAIVRENAVWRMRGESGAQQFIDERPDALPAVRAHLGKVLALIEREAPDWLLIPGGIYGVSAAYLAAAKRAGRPFSVFDSGPGLLLLSHTGIAAHHGDTAVAVEMLERERNARSLDFALAEGQRELDRRMTGADEHHYQLAPSTGVPAGNANILVPLNLRWDAAALSRLRLFDSVEHWLASLLEWTRRNPEARICIRQHPVERHALTRSVDNLGAMFARFADLGDRVRFVAADEAANSYDLMRAARVVLPFTSSAGIEAGMLGIPVVLGTHCYYERMPFVSRAETINEYFALISRALAGELQPVEQGRRAATLAYYFTQRCAYLRTPFTPVPDDFRTWSEISPRELWSLPEQSDLCEALLARQPLPLVQHRRFLRAK